MNRGYIWLIDLGGKTGTRPAVILTKQNVLAYLNKVSVVEVTTKGKGYPTEIFIGQKANLPKPYSVQVDNIQTVPKQRCEKYLGPLDTLTMNEVSKKVVLALYLKNCL